MPAHVRLFAPAGYPPTTVPARRGVARLESVGCRVSNTAVLDRVHQRFAGTDAERALDLNAVAELATLPDILLAVRGGYGATRLLPLLQYDALRERLSGENLVLVGHSDVTALQLALFARSGLVTVSGPMLTADFGAAQLSPFTWQHFWLSVTGPSMTVGWPSDAPELAVSGRLWGGNLTMLCSLIGTPYVPAAADVDAGILWVEDVGEAPYRIERLLYQLHLAGILPRQRALLVGDLSGAAEPAGADNGFGTPQVLAQIAAVSGIPVLTGLPIGHEPDKVTLPFGAPARLRAGGGKAVLDVSDYPHLATGPRPPVIPPLPD